MNPHQAAHICYEFDDFVLNPHRRSLTHNNEPRPLRPKAFQLLLVMVENHGDTISRERLVEAVWGNVLIAQINFDVTLTAVRKALGESARNPKYIIKKPDGYCFLENIRKVPEQSTGVELVGKETADAIARNHAVSSSPSSHYPHVWLSSTIYAALYAAALVLEVAYEFDGFSRMIWKTTPFIFAWIVCSSVFALMADQKLTLNGKRSGLAVSGAIFLTAAALSFMVLTRYLPSQQITQATIQAYPAQAAYLKDISYFLVIAFCFLIVPFHFIVAAERDLKSNRHRQIIGLLNGDELSTGPKGALYPRFWALALLLVVLAAFSLVMTSHLLDHLKPGPYSNLFTQLVYLRGVFYFGLGIECLIWYRRSIDEIKRQCVISLVD